jgi:hypothetical protein
MVFFALIIWLLTIETHRITSSTGKLDANGAEVAEDRGMCSLGIKSFMDAFYLSIETQTTIGYGVAHQYMRKDDESEGCTRYLFVLIFQSFFSVTLDAIFLGIFYTHISR